MLRRKNKSPWLDVEPIPARQGQPQAGREGTLLRETGSPEIAEARTSQDELGASRVPPAPCTPFPWHHSRMSPLPSASAAAAHPPLPPSLSQQNPLAAPGTIPECSGPAWIQHPTWRGHPRAEVLLSLLLPLFPGWDKQGQPSWRKQLAPGAAPSASAKPELLPRGVRGPRAELGRQGGGKEGCCRPCTAAGMSSRMLHSPGLCTEGLPAIPT